MAVYNVGGLSLFHREKTITDALSKALSGDEVNWNSQGKFEGTLHINEGIHLIGSNSKIKVGEHSVAMIFDGSGDLIVENFIFIIDNLSNGIRIKNWNGSITLRNCKIVYKKRYKQNKAYKLFITDDYLSNLNIILENCEIDSLDIESQSLTIKNSYLGSDIESNLSNNLMFFVNNTFKNTNLYSNELQLENSFFIHKNLIKSSDGILDSISFGLNKENVEKPTSISLDGIFKIQNTSFIDKMNLYINNSTINFKNMTLPKMNVNATNSNITLESVIDSANWVKKDTSISNKNIETSDNDIQIHDDTAINTLNSLIGLAPVKKVLEQYIATAKVARARSAHGLDNLKGSYHLVFGGSPGTGKTTVANLFGQALFEEGVIESPKVIIKSRDKLVGKYVGWTADNTSEAIEAAEGGILFIDEAYSLASTSENDYGHEVIDTLVNYMDSNRDNLIVIFAGYTEPIKKMIETSNEGLASRFNTWVEFPDYSFTELWEIMQLMLSGYNYTDEVLNYMQLKLFYFKKENLIDSNARFVRNFTQKVIAEQSTRLTNENKFDKESLNEIVISDVELAFEAFKNNFI